MPSSAIPPRGANLRHLRVNRPKRKASPSLRDECRAAVLPSLVIAAVWCLGCYIYLWISLYRSFTEDIGTHGKHIRFNKRRDILAIKLEQFLAGRDQEEDILDGDEGESEGIDGGQGNGNAIEVIQHSSSHVSSTLLEQVVDPNIAREIQSIMISETGYPNLILGAYLEPPLPTEESNGGSVERLQLRTLTPQDLTFASYPYQRADASEKQTKEPTLGACARRGAQFFPTFHPKALDKHFEGNVFKKHNDYNKRWELALGVGHNKNNTHGGGEGYCPVDADPFLPWIHDAFPSNDGSYIELVIANKRRCNTDPKVFQSDLKNLEPQVALMQPLPVKRMKEGEEDKYADTLKELWAPDSNAKRDINPPESFLLNDDAYRPPRYILGTSLDDADGDGKYTRFICRFHTLVTEKDEDATKGNPRLKKVVLGETLSTYPYNPEHANYRKRDSRPMLTPLEKGKDEQIWNSVYTARCPVPFVKDSKGNADENALASIVASGESVLEGTPTIYLDLIPIRTPPRRAREGFGIPGVTSASDGSQLFDPKSAWGTSHVLPLVEASGRWTNIPICHSPKLDELVSIGAEGSQNAVQDAATTSLGSTQNKTHFLVGCVWASESFATRGQTRDTDSSASDRLREFLAYHTKIAGFDHIFVYDNSDPSGAGDLSNVTTLFPPHLVTRIPWPHRVCNNNRPMHANPGERSSQYAAESSCRARYGPDTTWMATLDVDEYFVPTGKASSLRHWLEHVTAHEEKTKILSFFMTRALPDIDSMVPYDGVSTKACEVGGTGVLDSMCAMKDPAKTFMETYNCEPTTHPKPQSWAWRAKKQIYRPDYVLNHYVHYPVVTRRVLEKPLETSARFFERTSERRVNELTEGYLLHSKTTGPDDTSKWHEKCARKGSDSTKNSACKVGIASRDVVLGDDTGAAANGDSTGPSNGFESNCYRHSRVSDIVPKLEEALRSLADR